MATISRTAWGKQHDTCWLCGNRANPWEGRTLETHEIARGVFRAKAITEPAAWIRVCSLCHDTVGSMSIAAQLALKKIFDRDNYDRRRVNVLRDRMPDAITEEEVDAEVERLR